MMLVSSVLHEFIPRINENCSGGWLEELIKWKFRRYLSRNLAYLFFGQIITCGLTAILEIPTVHKKLQSR